jgi:2-oxo-4-hydroxy-4-carboxy-5-ureidoimidazoline decarboxylase
MNLAAFNDLDRGQAVATLLSCCSAPEWAGRVADARPFPSMEKLLDTADAALTAADLDAALEGHPRIGDRGASGRSAAEQGGVGDHVLDALAEANAAYEQRFGRVYLVCAAGRSGEYLLADLTARLAHDDETERRTALHELAAINRLRLGTMITT